MTELRRPRQHYQLRVADLSARYFEITLRVEEVDGEELRVWMASWVPGSYLMREYAGQVVDWAARSGDQELEISKIDKSTWSVDTSGRSSVEVCYRVYAPELTVRTSDINHEHAFVHPPATFLVVEGREDEPCSLRIEAPATWDIATALVHVGEHYLAENVDRLLDCPIEIGPSVRGSFVAGGRPHDFVIHGSGNYDLEKILADAEKICEEEIRLFGEVPFDRYLFLLHLTHDRGGGLEHMDSTALAWPKLNFRPKEKYHEFLTLVAHEYFHVWNVKRIRPEVFWRYRYDQEVYTRLLWVFEGITSYYDELVPLRAGCYGPQDFSRMMGKTIHEESNRPGREVQNLSDSSFDTWIKLYRPNADTQNSQSSYYQRGALVAWLLDLHIREQTGGERSLDDVMRHLWHETFGRGRGIAEGEIGALIQSAVGISVDDFISSHVEATGDLHYDHALASVGLRLADPEKKDTFAGVSIDSSQGESRLSAVRVDGPAHDAGWMADDVVVALDGHRVRGDLAKRIQLYSPGERIRWTSFRRDRLVEGEIEFSDHPQPLRKVVPVEDATDLQRAAFEAWSGQAWSSWEESSETSA